MGRKVSGTIECSIRIKFEELQDLRALVRSRIEYFEREERQLGIDRVQVKAAKRHWTGILKILMEAELDDR